MKFLIIYKYKTSHLLTETLHQEIINNITDHSGLQHYSASN